LLNNLRYYTSIFQNIEENQAKLHWDHSYHLIELLRDKFVATFMFKGHAVVQFVAALCYKLEGRGFNS
jgi:hypothetical protein